MTTVSGLTSPTPAMAELAEDAVHKPPEPYVPTHSRQLPLRAVSPLSEDATTAAFEASSTSSSSSSSRKFRGLRYKGRPPISEVPELLELCEDFIANKNVTGLAMLARQRGLPPSLRHKIWPVLLRYHPYVRHPYVEPELDDDDAEGDNNTAEPNTNTNKPSVPIKEIRFDLRKYSRPAERFKPKAQDMSADVRDLFEIQDKMFEAIENAIVKFVKKWGSILRYSSGLTWIALGLAEWVPPLPNSQFVLCGRDDIAKNGTKLRNVNDNYFERFEPGLQESPDTSVTIESTPVPGSPRSVSSLGTFSVGSESVPSQSSLDTDCSVYPFKKMTFAEVFERLVLVILHTPDPSEQVDGAGNHLVPVTNVLAVTESPEKKVDELPRVGGTIESRISFFLFALRKLMPELYNYLSDEGCLKGDWILWWLKYSGSKVWSRYDRGRTWDMLLGFRFDCRHREQDLEMLNQLSEEQLRLLGPDLFWYPNIDETTDATDDTKTPAHLNRSSSLLTLLNQVSVTGSISIDKTPTLTSQAVDDDVEPLSQLPFSVIDPQIQMIFVSLAFLKSKEFTILELDQMEIISLLNRISSLKTSEIRSFVSPDEVATDQHYHPARKSNRDIENIIIEAGELWRKFIYTEMMEENT